MSTIIDFTKFGGYRLEQPTLKMMQESYFLFLKALVGHLGVPDVGNFIISGCTISGENITEGVLFINGHVCAFENTPGTMASKIIKVVTTQNLEFENGTSPLIFTTYTTAINDGGTPLSEFVRIPSPFNLPTGIVIDENYVHTDSNFTAEEKTKLEEIEEGAEVNVQADWNVTNPGLDSYIKNKPLILKVLRVGHILIADITGTDNITVNFPSVGTVNYFVLPTFRLNDGSTSWQDTLTFFSTYGFITETSFNLFIRETSTPYQNLRMDYVIIQIPS